MNIGVQVMLLGISGQVVEISGQATNLYGKGNVMRDTGFKSLP